MDTTATETTPIEAKIAELKEKYKCDISCFALENPGEEDAIGYFIEPDVDTSLRMMDKTINGQAAIVADTLLQTNLIKEESDPRISRDNKKYWLGAVFIVMNSLEMARPVIKKK